MGRGRRCSSPSPHQRCWGWMSSRVSWPGTARSPPRWPGASRKTTPARWRRLLTDDHGRLLDYGSRTYRPPARLAAFIIARDQTCTFASCTRPAVACDLDHLTAAKDGGPTCDRNLHPLMSAASPLQTPHALATATPTRRIHRLDQPHRPHLPHPTPTPTDNRRTRDRRPVRTAPAARCLEPTRGRRPGPAPLLTPGSRQEVQVGGTCCLLLEVPTSLPHAHICRAVRSRGGGLATAWWRWPGRPGAELQSIAMCCSWQRRSDARSGR